MSDQIIGYKYATYTCFGLVRAKASPFYWHNCLIHLCIKIHYHLVIKNLVPSLLKMSPNIFCNLCCCNGSHCLPFEISSLQSHSPLIYFILIYKLTHPLKKLMVWMLSVFIHTFSFKRDIYTKLHKKYLTFSKSPKYKEKLKTNYACCCTTN